jgi:hypothetical protein
MKGLLWALVMWAMASAAAYAQPVSPLPGPQGRLPGTRQSELPPFIELDPHPAIPPPPGYRACLARDWDYYMVVQAEAVSIAPQSPTRRDLFFDYGGGGIITARRPAYPGEESHLFLPEGFVVPQEVMLLRAKPVPAALTRPGPRKKISIRFREESLPPGAAPGSRAYRGDFETFVFRGTVTGITGHPKGGFTFNRGSDVQIRKSWPGDSDKVSHIIVPPGYALPPEFIEHSPDEKPT